MDLKANNQVQKKLKPERVKPLKVKDLDLVKKKYQNLKCWQCGANFNGQMIICKCKSEPNRNDDFAKDGYSALCQTHKELIGKFKGKTEKLE